ncbi:hypothetical protein [Tahibacter soli]|uniref:Uncharacterized protein n=1 Tax=Tahibacter soli TaxID=2983605 RepID=A0A9X3YIE5_9GAMM|nr:hypothetical protein [Tahibacter soli]MDC8012197.1 hypothetical protein [Tahibacter soli]
MIRANPDLHFDANDFGLRFAGPTLEAPPKVFTLLYNLGARSPDLVVPTIEAAPSAFLHEFKLTREQLAHAHDTIEANLREHGIESYVHSGIYHPTHGAMRPRR